METIQFPLYNLLLRMHIRVHTLLPLPSLLSDYISPNLKLLFLNINSSTSNIKICVKRFDIELLLLFKGPYIKYVGGGDGGFLWGHEIF